MELAASSEDNRGNFVAFVAIPPLVGTLNAVFIGLGLLTIPELVYF
jgi:hypothetical protein